LDDRPSIIMDPLRKVDPFAINGPGDLRHGPLRQLEYRVTLKGPEAVSKQQGLDMYLDWLQNQVMNGTIAQDSNASLKSWVQSLTRLGFDEDNIYRSFQSWKCRVSQADPLTLRRFLIIEQDLQKLFEKGPASMSPNSNPGSNPSPPRSNKVNTRLPSEEQAEDQRRRGPQRSGANDLPIGKRRTRLSGPVHDIIEISEDSPSEPPAPSRPSTPTDPVPANYIFSAGPRSSDDFDDVIVTRETILLDTPPAKSTIAMGYTSGTPHSESKYEQPPPAGYTCKRCNRGGKESSRTNSSGNSKRLILHRTLDQSLSDQYGSAHGPAARQQLHVQDLQGKGTSFCHSLSFQLA
jgi:hypothetical protein